MQLELLEEDVGDGESQLVSPRLQRIRKGLAGVERTVHDFLNYATPNQQKPSLVELAEVIQPSCAGLRESAQVPLKMECTVAPGLKAWCDPHALRQILGNLFINAVRAQKGREATPSLRVEAVRNGAWIDILVDDAGPGVPPEHRQHIFDAFYTTHSEGTGLGLPIGRRLAEMNGGRLELASEPSPLGGARFILRLAARPAVRKPGKVQPASSSLTV
jgi:signal transduction histidine kinase